MCVCVLMCVVVVVVNVVVSQSFSVRDSFMTMNVFCFLVNGNVGYSNEEMEFFFSL